MKKEINKIIRFEKSLTTQLVEYFKNNSLRVYLSVVLIVVSFIFMRLPYVRLFLSQDLIIPLLVAVVIALLNIDLKVRAGFVVLLLAASCIMVLLKKITSSEVLANTVFFVLLSIAIKCIIDYRKEIKNG